MGARAGTSVLGQGAGNAALNGATLVLNFGTTLLLSRVLGADGYGAFAFAYALAMVLSVPAVLGLTPLLVREVTAYRLAAAWGSVKGIARRANETVVLASAVVCAGALVAFVATGWPGDELRTPTLLALPLVPLVAVTSVRQGVMQGFGRVVLGRAPEAVIWPGLLVIAAAGLAAALGDRFSAGWAVLAADVSALAAAGTGVVFLRRVLPRHVALARPSFETGRWARAAAPLVAFSLISIAGSRLPTVLLGALSTPEETGVYNVALRIANVLPFLLIAAMPALMPAIAELDVLARRDELQRLMTRAARLVLLGSLPIAAIAIVAAEPLLRLFGDDFGGGATALRILAIGQLVNIACGLPGTALIMSGDAKALTATATGTTTLSVVLATALVPSLGADGAAIASASAMVVSNLVLTAILWRRRGVYAPALLVPRSLR